MDADGTSRLLSQKTCGLLDSGLAVPKPGNYGRIEVGSESWGSGWFGLGLESRLEGSEGGGLRSASVFDESRLRRVVNTTVEWFEEWNLSVSVRWNGNPGSYGGSISAT